MNIADNWEGYRTKRLVNGDIQIVDDVPEGLPRGIRLI
jgi:hypothetical protein